MPKNKALKPQKVPFRLTLTKRCGLPTGKVNRKCPRRINHGGQGDMALE